MPTTNDNQSTFKPMYRQIPMPIGPKNTSRVPWLTSVHSVVGRGPFGTSSYRGNCGGHLIKDLLRYFKATSVLDPMSGGGTCADVCRHLGIGCTSFDLRAGRDAADASSYTDIGEFDFVWMHPPYWKMIRYNDDPRCLSNAPTLDAFIDGMSSVLRNCRSVLAPGGRIAVLLGGYSDRGVYHPLSSLLIARALAEGFSLPCTEIIRLQHGNTSSRKSYRSSFIPGLHDTCFVLKGD